METYRGPFDALATLPGRRAVTLGTFDGVHRGHQAILAHALRMGQEPGMDGAVVVTFARHPRAVLTPEHRPRMLTTEDEKLMLFAAMGIAHTVILEFDERLAALSYDAFVQDVLRARIGLAHFVLGHEVHFGRDRGGTFQTVADLADRLGFAVSQVASVRFDGQPISSTRVRDAIQQGRLDDAAAMMGHPYPVRGVVERGAGQGRGLGFPTANLSLLRSEKLLPPPGVYVCWGRPLGQQAWIPAVLNLGQAPTMTDGSRTRLEVHLLDEGQPELYGRTLEAALLSRIREEIRFASPQALSAQIRQDVAEARRRLVAAAGPARPERLDRLGPFEPQGGVARS
jgi:riboflavin kinase/FMN adenylyltransferase